MIKPTGSILLEWSISFKCAPGKLKEKISNTDIFLGKKKKKSYFTETTVSAGKDFEGKFLSRGSRTLQELTNAAMFTNT